MWARAGAIEPSLDFTTRLIRHTGEFGWWEVTFRARGGEAIENVRIEPGSGPVEFMLNAGREVPSLKAGWSSFFRVQLNGPKGTKGTVRITQGGRVPRTYDVELGTAP